MVCGLWFLILLFNLFTAYTSKLLNMETLTENAANVIGYTKCGEILRSEKNLQHHFLYRCIDCKETYTLLDLFISHLNGKCTVRNKAESNVDSTKVKVEPVGYEELPVNMSQVKPLLARIKSEDISADEFISLKVEVKLKHATYSKKLTYLESDVSVENFRSDVIEPQINDNDIEDNSDSSIDIDPEDLYNQLWMKMKNLENNGEGGI